VAGLSLVSGCDAPECVQPAPCDCPEEFRDLSSVTAVVTLKRHLCDFTGSGGWTVACTWTAVSVVCSRVTDCVWVWTGAEAGTGADCPDDLNSVAVTLDESAPCRWLVTLGVGVNNMIGEKSTGLTPYGTYTCVSPLYCEPDSEACDDGGEDLTEHYEFVTATVS
jgi:hypothetical protein